MRRQGFRLGVGRFVAGEHLPEALAALERLEASGLHGILDLLGEFIEDEAGVEAAVAGILAALDALAGTPVDRYLSVKPTQLGLALDPGLALENARLVAERARSAGAQVCLDMESSEYVDGTLDLYRALHTEGHHHVSTVLQSYLYRTRADLESLLGLSPAPAIRIVKGAYRESPEVAHQDKRKVDSEYRELVWLTLEGGARANVATHDEAIISEVAAYARERGLGPDRFEFQLLYGVKPRLQQRLVQDGHLVRVYVPYGHDWYGYFSRRLAERPANLAFVLRGLVG